MKKNVSKDTFLLYLFLNFFLKIRKFRFYLLFTKIESYQESRRKKKNRKQTLEYIFHLNLPLIFLSEAQEKVN